MSYPTEHIMRATSEQHIGVVQRRVAKGEYRVDSGRVAAAMLQKIGAIVLGREISSEADHVRSPAASDRPEA